MQSSRQRANQSIRKIKGPEICTLSLIQPLEEPCHEHLLFRAGRQRVRSSRKTSILQPEQLARSLAPALSSSCNVFGDELVSRVWAVNTVIKEDTTKTCLASPTPFRSRHGLQNHYAVLGGGSHRRYGLSAIFTPSDVPT